MNKTFKYNSKKNTVLFESQEDEMKKTGEVTEADDVEVTDKVEDEDDEKKMEESEEDDEMKMEASDDIEGDEDGKKVDESDEVSDGHESEEGKVGEVDKFGEVIDESDDNVDKSAPSPDSEDEILESEEDEANLKDDETLAEAFGDEDEEKVEESEEEDEEAKKATDESVNTLIKALGLTKESFAEVKTIFKAAIAENVAKQTTLIKNKYRGVFERKLAREKKFIVTQLDVYTESVVKDWTAKNTKALESAVHAETSARLVEGMFKLIKENNITVPAGKTNAFAALTESHANLKRSFEKMAKENRKLQEKADELEIKSVVESLTGEMTDSNKEKFGVMLENFEFDSVADFKKKSTLIFESFYSNKGKKNFKPTRIVESTTATNTNGLGLGGDVREDEVTRYAKFMSGQK